MLKWVKHLDTVILNIQGKKYFLRFLSEIKKNLTSITKPFGKTFDWFSEYIFLYVVRF